MAGFLELTVDKFIFKVATDRLYSPEGIWVQDDGNGRVRVGITDYQQQLGGDVAFVHLKSVGTNLALGDELVEIETIKTTISFPTPVTGQVVDLNGNVHSAPETVNEAPYGRGWLAVLEAGNWESDRSKLLEANAYLAAIRAQAEEELKK